MPARPCSPRRCSRRRSPAVYLVWAPAERGPRRGDLPGRPVLRPRVRALEQRLVLGPLHALLQRHSTRRSGPCSARALDRGARGGRGGGPVRGARSARFGAAGAVAVAVVRGRGRRLAADRPDARSCSRCRSASPRCSPPTRGSPGSPPARSPRSRAWPARSPACSSPSPAPRSCSPASARAGSALARRRGGPDRRPQPRLPDRRLRAVRVLGLHRDPAASRRSSLARPGRAPGAADRRGPLRAARDRPVHGRQPARRQRHPARGAVRGPVLALVALAARAAGS